MPYYTEIHPEQKQLLWPGYVISSGGTSATYFPHGSSLSAPLKARILIIKKSKREQPTQISES